MGSDGTSCIDTEDEEMAEVGSQVSQSPPVRTAPSRPSKRRRISSTSEDDSLDDFVVDSDSDHVSKRNKRRFSRESAASASDGETRMGGMRRRGRSRISTVGDTSCDEAKEEPAREKRKSRYHIHIPKDHELPPPIVEYATQVPDVLEDPDSSPYRIRGAVWKFQKPRKITATPKTLSVPTATPARPDPGETKNATASSTEFRSKTAPLNVSSPEYEDENDGDGGEENNAFTPNPAVEDPYHEMEVDYAHEIEDLPSDAFLSSPVLSSPEKNTSTHLSTRNMGLDLPNPPTLQLHVAASQPSLRQTTLFGGRAQAEVSRPSQANKVHNYRADRLPEEATHHMLLQEATKTWIYPINLGAIRDYQYSIVSTGLFNNTLVALPTGLGKTFIAATIMFNFFRWTKDAQIVFMAPTKPLVSQQVDACFNVVGIPRSATTLLTGQIAPALRAEAWQAKRVFFMTPQTLENDLRSGHADPKRIVLLVIDEAHRATGNYAYVKVIKLMRTFSKSFRVLALTATPGTDVEAVQEVIDGLEISKIEIRTEDSIDIQQFVHQRNIEQIELEPSDEMIMVQELVSKSLQPLVDLLCSQNAYYNKDPMSLTPFGMTKASRQWQADAGRRASAGLKGMMMGLFTVLASFAHSIKLLNMHGIGPFYQAAKDFRTEVEWKGSKGGKYRKQINDSPHFKKLMDRIQAWINRDDFVGHPKLTYLCDTILNHFLDAGDGRRADNAPPSATRVIVFSEFRDSAGEIVRVLNRHRPLIRASVFVGQANSKRTDGMSQKTQIETINKFKLGTFNVLVATSIGEEGLDIGQVDLIVCYDASASPIRMLQRMGRTGRKRAGKIVLLLMKGKEKESFGKAKDNYEHMQKLICDGSRFNFRHDLSSRIIPRDTNPVVEKKHIEIPLENTQDTSLPEPKKTSMRAKKRPAKKFHMPDGAETGFRKASKLVKNSTDSDSDLDTEAEIAKVKRWREQLELSNEQETPIPALETVFLVLEDEKELERRYQSVQGDGSQEVSLPEMTNHPASQRSLRPTKQVKHGRYTQRFVAMIRNVRGMTETITNRWQQLYAEYGPLDEPDPPLSSSDETSRQEPVREPAMGGFPQRRRSSESRQPQRHLAMGSSDDDSETFTHCDLDADLEGFVVGDTTVTYDREHDGDSTLCSSPLQTPMPKSKLFFEPTDFPGTQDTNDDDDMPDVGDILGSRRLAHCRSPLKETQQDCNRRSKPGRTRKRRVVVQDDSDE
ncbi:MAG: 3'-5' DNA helicase [Claussenomyces sp. TS43310]|nr:MAG: 3'-5' DNA helicase [Claussenomyces sp. TS43310]